MRAVPVMVAALLAATALANPAAAAAATDFDNPGSTDTRQQTEPGNVQRQDTPNDPGYDSAEPDSQRKDPNASFDSERFDLFGFPSSRTPGAVYKDGPFAGKPQISGFNAAGAWKRERGRSDVFVAILDTGIRWEKAGLRTRVHLNTAELPLPQRADGTTALLYDANGDGVVNVDDYAGDARVGKAKPTGQDLIATFGFCQIAADHLAVPGTCAGTTHYDNDNNGFANDIAGWDFFNNTNDPVDRSSYFAARDHGSGRANDAVEAGNDASGSLGVCPKCQFVPIRIYDTFVSDGNSFALGIVYGTNLGASVIEGANGSLTHTAFSEAASQYAYDHGVTQAYSGNDLNTGDHNYPANYNHVMEIQGTVPDGGAVADNELQTIPADKRPPALPGSLGIIGTYFRGANTTQFGGHSSISMEGSTGSQNTGKASGAAALVVAAGLDGGRRLSPDEVRELLEQTAEPVTTANAAGAGVADPGVLDVKNDSHFTTHFGWGRANVGAAVQRAFTGDIPADASIVSPDWYAPVTGPTARITGLASAPTGAPAGASFTWTLKMGPGLAPRTLTTVRSGTSSAPVTDFGTINLADVRTMLADPRNSPAADPGGPTFAPGARDPYQDQFSVELDVSYAGSTLTGIDRKVLTALPADSTLLGGAAVRLGTGGEAPPRYTDLNGDGVQELLVPGEDGLLRALEPDGSELPGWPFATPVQFAAADHGPALLGLPPARESLRGFTVADLTGDGTQEVVVTAGTHLWALEPDGSVAPGFPVSVDPARCVGTDQSQPLRHRKCGISASPAVGHLVKGNPSLQIVVPALDGSVYAWDAAGRLLPNYPVDLSDPAVAASSRQLAESITNPTLRDLNNDGVDDIIAASNEAYGGAVTPGPGDASGGPSSLFGDAFSAIGGTSRLYAINGATGAFLPGWPVKLPGAIQNVLPFIGPGHDAATFTDSNGAPLVVASTTGGVVSEFNAAGTLVRGIQQSAYGPGSNVTDRSGVFNLFEYATVGDVLGAGRPAVVKYGLSLGQVVNLLLAGQNVPYNHMIGAYDAGTGAPLPAYPTVTDDYQFLSSSTIAKVVPGPTNQILAGTGLGLLHAYDGATGKDVAGFPKVTGGWLFAPAALSDDHRIAAITREGYLFQWSTDPLGPTCQSEWPTFRHDPHNSGDYNTDGTAPGAPLSLTVSGRTLTFASPGDDAYCGTPASYVVRVDGALVSATGPVRPGRQSAVLTLPFDPAPGSRITVLGKDEVGNTGTATAVAVPAAPASASPTASTSASPSSSTSPSPGASAGASSSPAASSSPGATGRPTASAASSPSPAGSGAPSVSPGPSSGPGSGPAAGLFHPLQPSRVVDTRLSGDPVVAGQDRVLHLSGEGGVPRSGVSAVVLSVTVPLPTQAGDLEVYPVGFEPPARTSNLNWPARRTIANLVTVPLGQGGSVELSVSTARVHAVVDVLGWYGDGSDSGGKRFTAVTPSRAVDTGNAGLRAGSDLRVVLRGRSGVPNSADVTGVVATVTALGTTGPADLQVYPTGNRPSRRTSNLNLNKGQTAAVLVDATLGSDGSISLSLSATSARVAVDVLGYFSDSGDRYVALSPRRVLDRGTVTAGTDRSVQLAGQNGVPPGASAVLVNATGVDATRLLDLQVYPTGSQPAQRTSVLNVVPSLAVADLVSTRLGNGAASLSVSQGSLSVILDLEGYFTPG